MIGFIVAFMACLLGYWILNRKSNSGPTYANVDFDKTSASSPDVAEGDSDKPPMSIFYGSQSGTAETFAQSLHKEALRRGFSAKLIDFEDFESESLSEHKFAVMLVATHGEGEPTDSSEEVYTFLSDESIGDDELEGMQFCVFGLGNQQYEFYNRMGSEFDRLCEAAGGERVLDLGLGNDDGTLEEDFAEWKVGFWKMCRTRFLGSSADGDDVLSGFVRSFTCEVISESHADYSESTANPLQAVIAKHNALEVKVLSKKQLRQDTKGGSSWHFELDFSPHKNFRYRTADDLAVVPRNSHKMVAQLAKRLGVRADDVFVLEPVDSDSAKPHIPRVCTVRDAFLWHCDITRHPSRSHISALLEHCKDDAEHAELELMTQLTDAGKAAYHGLMQGDKNAHRVTWLSLLERFPSLQPPLGLVLELLPRLQPRYYTIASSNRVQPKQVALCFNEIRDASPQGEFQGVCSSYLCSLRPDKDDSIVAFLRPSAFRLPPNPSTPIVMVGAGTGLAPFRGFVQEGMHLRKKGVELGDWNLVFGCRYSDRDFLYKDELTAAAGEELGCLDNLWCAFSREQEEKVYVQDRIRDHGKDVWDVIASGGRLYVCGSTSMGKAVREAFIEAIQEHGKKPLEAAQDFMHKLQQSQPPRFVQELW